MEESFSQSTDFPNINKYELAIAIAKRARDITERYNLSGESCPEKAVSMAIQDFKKKFCVLDTVDS